MLALTKPCSGTRFNSQREYNDMTTALRDQVRWCLFGSEMNVFDTWNPVRPLMQWYNTRRMNRYINRELQARYDSHHVTVNDNTIIGLALKNYFAEYPDGKTNTKIDPVFKRYALSQVKLFIHGGHDTTATTICYLFLLLSRNPSAMQKLRAEHDAVLGNDTEAASLLLLSQPHLINHLPYTLATIKETLRLFPVVTSPRAGQPAFSLLDASGRQYPTEQCLVWSNHHGLHTNPLWWPRVEEFLPERFLVPEGDPLRPIKNAWRPFEFGPRNCIGQELALTELKLVLAITARDFDVTDAYREWDSAPSQKKSNVVKTVNGERAYQISLGSARPSDGFPARADFAAHRANKSTES